MNKDKKKTRRLTCFCVQHSNQICLSQLQSSFSEQFSLDSSGHFTPLRETEEGQRKSKTMVRRYTTKMHISGYKVFLTKRSIILPWVLEIFFLARCQMLPCRSQNFSEFVSHLVGWLVGGWNLGGAYQLYRDDVYQLLDNKTRTID